MLSNLKLKKVLALFLLISFIPFTLHAQEQRGRYTRLSEGGISPFDAWCFDDPAFAIINESALSYVSGFGFPCFVCSKINEGSVAITC